MESEQEVILFQAYEIETITKEIGYWLKHNRNYKIVKIINMSTRTKSVVLIIYEINICTPKL
jgi:predicted site-specific integrase-resolvase